MPSRYCYFTNNTYQVYSNQLLRLYLAWNDPTHTDRHGEFYEKKFFRVALARFGSVRLCTPAPLCGLWLIVKRLRLCIVHNTPRTPPEDTRNSENFQRSQSFRALENILHTFFANFPQIVWRLENIVVSLYCG